MEKIVILGAGTMTDNRMQRLLNSDEWSITIVDQPAARYYQPGFLFIPCRMYSKNDVIKPKRNSIPAGVELIMSPIETIEP
jgi:sulfide:quinone oxidoreductase